MGLDIGSSWIYLECNWGLLLDCVIIANCVGMICNEFNCVLEMTCYFNVVYFC